MSQVSQEMSQESMVCERKRPARRGGEGPVRRPGARIDARPSTRRESIGRWRSPAAIRSGLAAGALALLLAPVPGLAGVASPSGAGDAGGAPAAPGISGDYLEARTADVYTGPCFANSEMGLAGKQAVVAWRVRQGAWQGVPLDGLSVVAAVRSTATLGDPFGGPLHARAVIVVDRRATPLQRDALVAFAHAMAGDLLSTVVAIDSAPIEMSLGAEAVAGDDAAGGVAGERALSPEALAARVEHPAERRGHHRLAGGLAVAGISGEAHLKAGNWVDLATRGIGPKDHLCG